MTIFGFRTTGPIPGHDDKYNPKCTGRRWALVADRWRIGVEDQWQWNHGAWTHCLHYFNVGIRCDIRFGRVCVQYDGFHHQINLGPFYVAWWSHRDWPTRSAEQ